MFSLFCRMKKFLFHELIVDSFQRNYIIIGIDTYYYIKLARALIYHADINTVIRKSCENSCRSSLCLYHASANYSDKRKIILYRNVFGVNGFADA